VAATPPATKREKLDAGPPSAPSKKQKKAAAKAAKLAAEAQAGKKSEGKKEKDEEKKVKEGLARMDGGNPAGPPCRNFAKGTCVGKCRFSHEAASSPDEEAEE
jgi:hypothetical protein